MLKNEEITVSFDDFEVSELSTEDTADLRDDLRVENPSVGQNKFLFLLSQAIFVRRVKSWPYSEECNTENKQEFFKQFTGKANEVISAARIKIDKRKDELLGNLLSGASGT